jgi:hypothetical protein
MPQNTPYEELKEAIQSLEKKQEISRQLLQEQFKVTYESLSPFNILKSSLSSITGSPEIRNNLVSLLLPLASGFFSKKAYAGTQRPTVLKQAGILLLDGLNRYIAQNPEVINTISHYILNIFRKKKPAEETD